MNHHRERELMQKLWATAQDPSCNPHVRDMANRKLAELSKRSGIPVDNSLEFASDQDPDKFNIKSITISDITNRIPFEMRLIVCLLGEHFGVEIVAVLSPVGMRAKLSIPKPGDLNEPARMLVSLLEIFDRLWTEYREENKWKNKETSEKSKWFIPAFLGKPHRKSYMSGLYNGFRERLSRERSTRIRLEAGLKERMDVPQQAKRETLALIEDREPVEPPSPFALMVVEKAVSKPEKKKKPKAPKTKSQETPMAKDFDKTSYTAGYFASFQVKI